MPREPKMDPDALAAQAAEEMSPPSKPKAKSKAKPKTKPKGKPQPGGSVIKKAVKKAAAKKTPAAAPAASGQEKLIAETLSQLGLNGAEQKEIAEAISTALRSAGRKELDYYRDALNLMNKAGVAPEMSAGIIRAFAPETVAESLFEGELAHIPALSAFRKAFGTGKTGSVEKLLNLLDLKYLTTVEANDDIVAKAMAVKDALVTKHGMDEESIAEALRMIPEEHIDAMRREIGNVGVEGEIVDPETGKPIERPGKATVTGATTTEEAPLKWAELSTEEQDLLRQNRVLQRHFDRASKADQLRALDNPAEYAKSKGLLKAGAVGNVESSRAAILVSKAKRILGEGKVKIEPDARGLRKITAVYDAAVGEAARLSRLPAAARAGVADELKQIEAALDQLHADATRIIEAQQEITPSVESAYVQTLDRLSKAKDRMEPFLGEEAKAAESAAAAAKAEREARTAAEREQRAAQGLEQQRARAGVSREERLATEEAVKAARLKTAAERTTLQNLELDAEDVFGYKAPTGARVDLPEAEDALFRSVRSRLRQLLQDPQVSKVVGQKTLGDASATLGEMSKARELIMSKGGLSSEANIANLKTLYATGIARIKELQDAVQSGGAAATAEGVTPTGFTKQVGTVETPEETARISAALGERPVPGMGAAAEPVTGNVPRPGPTALNIRRDLEGMGPPPAGILKTVMNIIRGKATGRDLRKAISGKMKGPGGKELPFSRLDVGKLLGGFMVWEAASRGVEGLGEYAERLKQEPLMDLARKYGKARTTEEILLDDERLRQQQGNISSALGNVDPRVIELFKANMEPRMSPESHWSGPPYILQQIREGNVTLDGLVAQAKGSPGIGELENAT